jgi:hypothetical protein
MIIDNFNLFWPVLKPIETDAIWIVYPNTKLSFSITRSSFEAIYGWYAEFIQKCNWVKWIEFSGGKFPQGDEIAGFVVAGFRLCSVKDLNDFRRPACQKSIRLAKPHRPYN